jgi:flagellar protein FliS
MYQSMYGDLETEVLTAEPIKLVQMMYRGAVEAIAGARAALVAGDIKTRSRLISKAMAILNELATSLDHSKDPELCRNLVELYDYMLRKLIEANTRQIEAPLVEAGRLLGDLLSAWEAAARMQDSQPVSYASQDSHVEMHPVSDDGTYCGPEPGYPPAAEYHRVSYAY